MPRLLHNITVTMHTVSQIGSAGAKQASTGTIAMGSHANQCNTYMYAHTHNVPGNGIKCENADVERKTDEENNPGSPRKAQHMAHLHLLLRDFHLMHGVVNQNQ